MAQAAPKPGLLGRFVNLLRPATISASAAVGSQAHRPPPLNTTTQAATSFRSGRRPHDVQARLDSQFTTPLNAGHFALMDAMSVDAMASWMVRRKIRMMCRYEYHNNPLMMGVCDTYADYVIGTGPKLQILTKNRKFNDAVEAIYSEWA